MGNQITMTKLGSSTQESEIIDLSGEITWNGVENVKIDAGVIETADLLKTQPIKSSLRYVDASSDFNSSIEVYDSDDERVAKTPKALKVARKVSFKEMHSYFPDVIAVPEETKEEPQLAEKRKRLSKDAEAVVKDPDVLESAQPEAAQQNISDTEAILAVAQVDTSHLDDSQLSIKAENIKPLGKRHVQQKKVIKQKKQHTEPSDGEKLILKRLKAGFKELATFEMGENCSSQRRLEKIYVKSLEYETNWKHFKFKGTGLKEFDCLITAQIYRHDPRRRRNKDDLRSLPIDNEFLLDHLKVANKKHSYNLSKREMLEIVPKARLEVVRLTSKIRQRQKQAEMELLIAAMPEDPAKNDQELKRKLAENERTFNGKKKLARMLNGFEPKAVDDLQNLPVGNESSEDDGEESSEDDDESSED